MIRLIVLFILSICLAPDLLSGVTVRRSVREVLTIGARHGEELYSVSGVATDQESNIYVTDVMDYSVKKFDAHGRFLAKAGRRGGGPGEFKAPATCVIWRDTLAVMQMNDPSVQLFSSGDLHYIKSIRMHDGLPMDIAFDYRGKLNVALLEEGINASVSECDIESQLAPRRIRLAPTGKQSMLFNACKVASSSSIPLIVAYCFVNRIDFYDGSGKVYQSIMFPGIRTLSDDGPGEDLPRETFTKGVVVDHKGNVWVLGGSVAEHDSRDICVFSTRGTVLFSVELPDKTRTLTLDANGFIYGTAAEGTLVRKYKLIPG